MTLRYFNELKSLINKTRIKDKNNILKLLDHIEKHVEEELNKPVELCSTCIGDTNCTTCEGNGKCPDCCGTGDCSYCDGKGYER